jgi:hypothetical protein
MRRKFVMRARTGRCASALLSCVACSAAPGVRAEGEPAVTPYRPTVSNPADLPVAGWLEAEFGGLRLAGEDRSRGSSVPWLLKYAFDADHGLLLGGNAYVAATTPGEPRRSGVGDTTLEWKQRFAIADGAAFGIEGGVTLPSARHGLGAGKPVWLINAIYSGDFAATHLDVNIGAAHAAQHDVGTSAWQRNAAVCVSWSFGPAWGGALEVSGAQQRGTATQSQALAALNYNVSPRLVLDAGIARGLAHGAHDRSVFAGATVLLGRVH